MKHLWKQVAPPDGGLRKVFVKLVEWAPALIVAGVVWGLSAPLLHHTPLTHDHPTHLFKAWHFYEKMLPEFRLRGFSHYWVFGHPAGELVPFGEEIWVALFRALTFEQFSWMRTYSLSLIGLIGLIASSAYIFAKRYFGPFVGMISALFVVWDPGAWAQMGWEWFMRMGVWPNSLGVALLLLSVVALESVMDRFTLHRFVIAALLVASSLLTHQITLVFLPIFLVLMCLDRWVGGRLRASSIKNGFAAVVLGAGLSAFYVLPMVSRGHLTIDLGVAGVPLENVGERLVDERLFHGLWQVLVPIGFVGGFVALKRRIPGAVFLSVGIGLFVLASTDFAFTVLHLERVLPLLTKVEASRMLVGARVLWFPLVAYGMSLPFEAFWTFVREKQAAPRPFFRTLEWRWVAVWGLALLLLSPYVPSAVEKLYRAQVKKTLPPENVAFFQDLKQLWATTRSLREKDESLYRIAYDLPMHDHIATLAPVFDDTWIYKVGYTPTQTFVQFPMYFDDELFRKLMVKYVVSQRSLPKRSFELMHQFGDLRLYRFLRYDGRPFQLEGDGTARVLQFAPERIVLKMQGTSEGSRLELFVSHLDHWRATLNGQQLPISPTTAKGPHDPFLMAVPVRDGELIFDYIPRLPDVLGRVASIASVISFGGWTVLRRARKKGDSPPLFAQRTIDWLRDKRRTLRLTGKARVLALALSLLALGGLLWQRTQSRTALVSTTSLFRSVPAGTLTLDEQPCKETQPLVFSCGSKKEVAAKWVSGLYGSHLCMSAPQEGVLTYRRTVRFHEALRGRYDPSSARGRISVRFGQEPPLVVPARPRDQGQQFLRFDTRKYAGTDRELLIEVHGSALHCFDFYWEK